MAKGNIAKNYIYNITYQMLLLMLPLVTTPYVSRVLGAENIGIYSYTQSIAAYFILFGSLGIALYGQREIAYCQNDIRGYSKTFWEIFCLRAITLCLAITVYWFVFAAGDGPLSLYYKILALEIVGNIFDISWLFQGLEDFRKTATRSILVKLVSVVCVFLFVKSREDLALYFLIYILSVVVGNLSLWLYLPQLLVKVEMRKMRIFRHLMPTVALFIPQIAIQIYTLLDRVMIGAIIADKSEVGYYEQSQRIIKILMTVVTSLGVVLMPRIANFHASGDKERITRYIKTSFSVVFILAFPIIFGLWAITESFVPVFFGAGYDKVSILMILTAPIILFIGMSSVMGNQYLLAVKRQREYTASVVCGALINLICNSLLIPFYGAVGAAIGTLVAEFTVIGVQLFLTRKDFEVFEILHSGLKYLLGSALMYGVLMLLNLTVLRQASDVLLILIDVAVGVIVYFVFLAVFKDAFLLDLLEKAKQRLRRGSPL